MSVVTVFSACSLLWLPEHFLLHWHITLLVFALLLVSIIICVLCGKNHWISPLIFVMSSVGILGYIHDQARQTLLQADLVAQLPRKIETEFKIIEVLQQKKLSNFCGFCTIVSATSKTKNDSSMARARKGTDRGDLERRATAQTDFIKAQYGRF
ncbi:recombination protein 2 [Pasteurella multocida]|nr:recombination protein 2 [Pasteurella multocida]